MAEDRTNWVSWVLQGLLGSICGLYFGYELSHTREGPWIQPGGLAMAIWGMTLLGAGIATIYGDQLWMQFPNQRPIRPTKSPAGGSASSCRIPCAR